MCFLNICTMYQLHHKGLIELLTCFSEADLVFSNYVQVYQRTVLHLTFFRH